MILCMNYFLYNFPFVFIYCKKKNRHDSPRTDFTIKYGPKYIFYLSSLLCTINVGFILFFDYNEMDSIINYKITTTIDNNIKN